MLYIIKILYASSCILEGNVYNLLLDVSFSNKVNSSDCFSTYTQELI